MQTATGLIVSIARMALLAGMLLGTSALAGTNANLMVNGSFDDPANPLRGWKYDYADTGNANYVGNKAFVSVVEDEVTKKKVAKFKLDFSLCDNQGVKLDSAPIPYEKGAKYRLSAMGRSDGPGVRLLIEGYRWRPGIKPHDNPGWDEIRKCYVSLNLYFGGQTEGKIASLSPQWQKGTLVFPDEKLSDMAKKNLEMIQFLVVHICAIGGSYQDLINGGYKYLYLDDIEIVKLDK